MLKSSAKSKVLKIPLIESFLVRAMYPDLDLTESLVKIIREKCFLDISQESTDEVML